MDRKQKRAWWLVALTCLVLGGAGGAAYPLLSWRFLPFVAALKTNDVASVRRPRYRRDRTAMAKIDQRFAL